MNCPRCSAQLPDSAISCFQCGSPIRSASFSYLPAGTPPWPTTVPQNFSYAAGTSLQPIQAVSTTEQGEYTPVAKGTARTKRSKMSLPLMIALFVVSILVGGGTMLGILYASGGFSSNSSSTQASGAVPLQQTPNPTSSATAGTQGNQLPTPSAFLAINSNDLGISLKYPQGWIASAPQKTTSGNTSMEFHPLQQIPIDFIVGRISANNSAQIQNTNQVNQANLSQIQGTQGVSNFQTIQPGAPQRSVGGTQWDEQDATFSNSQGATFHFTTITVQHNKLYYTIFFYAPGLNYNEAIQKYFQPMFDSFKFLT